MSKVTEAELVGLETAKNGHFVDAVSRMIGEERFKEVMARVGGSRTAIIDEARRLLQNDKAPKKKSGKSGQRIGKDEAAQGYA